MYLLVCSSNDMYRPIIAPINTPTITTLSQVRVTHCQCSSVTNSLCLRNPEKVKTCVVRNTRTGNVSMESRAPIVPSINVLVCRVGNILVTLIAIHGGYPDPMQVAEITMMVIVKNSSVVFSGVHS